MPTTPELAAGIDAYMKSAAEDADTQLDELCRATIYPLAVRVVRSKLPPGSDDVHDVVQVVVLRLAMELRTMRQAGQPRLDSAVGWVVASAVNACRDHFRAANRPRTQLANAVRYVLRHSSAFKRWTHAGRKVCGWHRCVGTPPLSPGHLATLMQHPAIIEWARRVEVNNASTVRRMLARIFALAHGSIDQGMLVPAIVEASGMPGSLIIDSTTVPEPVATTASDEMAIQRQLLCFFWTAALELPREQRLSLLLHLAGTDGVHAFWERGAVSRTDVATALSLAEKELGGLPWSDLQIAEFIENGTSPTDKAAVRATGEHDTKRRQQRVINWRRDARRALDARIRTYLRGPARDNLRE